MYDAVLYSIEIYKTELSLNEYYRLCGVFRYHCKRDGISCLLVYSTKDSAVSETIPERTGKRGRPVYRVVGKNEPPHIHCAVIGTCDKSAYSTCQRIKSSINQRYGFKAARIVSKGRGEHARIFIGYSLRQADCYRTCGDFDFLEACMQDKQ